MSITATPAQTKSKTVAIATDPRNLSATALAAIGLFNWLLQTYVFHGNTPPEVATSLYIILPALVGYLTTHIALNMYPPKELAKLRANFQAAAKGNKIMVLPQSETATPLPTLVQAQAQNPTPPNPDPKDAA